MVYWFLVLTITTDVAVVLKRELKRESEKMAFPFSRRELARYFWKTRVRLTDS